MPTFSRHLSHHHAERLLDHLDRTGNSVDEMNRLKARLKVARCWQRRSLRKEHAKQNAAFMRTAGSEVQMILDVPDVGAPAALPTEIVLGPDASQVSFNVSWPSSVAVHLKVDHHISSSFPELVKALQAGEEQVSPKDKDFYQQLLSRVTTIAMTPTTEADWGKLALAYAAHNRMVVNKSHTKRTAMILRKLGLTKHNYSAVMNIMIRVNRRTVESTLSISIDLTE